MTSEFSVLNKNKIVKIGLKIAQIAYLAAFGGGFLKIHRKVAMLCKKDRFLLCVWFPMRVCEIVKFWWTLLWSFSEPECIPLWSFGEVLAFRKCETYT